MHFDEISGRGQLFKEQTIDFWKASIECRNLPSSKDIATGHVND